MNPKRISLAATAILVVAVVSLLLRQSLFAHGPLAVVLQVVAAALMLWARVTFGGRSLHAGARSVPVSGLFIRVPARGSKGAGSPPAGRTMPGEAHVRIQGWREE